MYILATDKNLETGTYLSITNKGNKATLLKGDEKVGTIIVNNDSIFKNRNLKAVIREKVKEGYKVSIVRFADIHRHSGYSLLDGMSKIKDMVEKTEYVGALTDHGNMYGFLEYYKEMKKAGKQPIIGFEAYCETLDGKKEGRHLILLAKNQKGYKNLIKLTSLAFENFYRNPHVSYEMLEKYNEGIIATSACIGSEMAQEIKNGNYERAKEVATRLKSIFKEDFYIEIQRHNMGREEDVINRGLVKLSKETGIKLVAATDSHYTNKDEGKIHEILLCLQTGKTLKDKNRMTFDGDGYHIHSADEMDFKFRDIPEALDNTLEIAEKCSGFELDLDSIYMPKFEVPEGHTEDSYLEKLTWEGFESRFQGKPELNSKEYKKRIEYELKVIKEMKYSAYFLIVSDFINFAKNNGIAVGPGRGSAAGSLVTYSIGITDINPIPYGLLFERFLNPERVSFPDIDVDFCYERRDEVIEYVRKKYGENSVSKIITFGTMAARSVVRDVGRVMDYPYYVADKIAKLIPSTPRITLKKAMEDNPELKTMYKDDADVKKIIDIAFRLEGLPRHASTHACGIVISDGDVDNYIPEAMMGDDGVKEKTSQVTMAEVEDLGLLKMDFLGLRTMTVIDYTIKGIKEGEGEKISYLTIPNNDPYVYEDLSKGKSYGVFQLESAGMSSLMSEVYSDVGSKIREIEDRHKVRGFKSPEGEKNNIDAFIKEMGEFGEELFERLIAGVALYRPGPMDYIPSYIEGMLNPEKITYDTPELKPILEATYSQIVYQEQVIRIVQELAGYSLGRADLVRRAMGKKIDEIMREEKDYFINGKLNDDGSVDVLGCVKNGIPKRTAETIWDKMEDFTRYAFNKSHATAYARIGIITAWLKYYYPVDFMAATINSFIGSSDKIKIYISICKDMGISILAPDINRSSNLFVKDGDDIIFGLKAIKNIGSTSDLILEERKERGPFKNIQDFTTRMARHHRIDKRTLEGLIYSGALDSFEGTRRAKIQVSTILLKDASREKSNANQVNIFEIIPEGEKLKKIPIPDISEFEKDFKLKKEKEFASFYVTEHPLDEYSEYLKNQNISEIGFLLKEREDEEGEHYYQDRPVKIAGIIEDLKIFYTKKDNKPLYVFQLEDRGGEIKCVIFSNKIEQNQDKLFEGNKVVIRGELREDDFGLQVIVDDINNLKNNRLKEKQIDTLLYLDIVSQKQMDMLTNEILNVKKYKGETPVYVSVNGKVFKSRSKINTDIDEVCIKLKNIFGERYMKDRYY